MADINNDFLEVEARNMLADQQVVGRPKSGPLENLHLSKIVGALADWLQRTNDGPWDGLTIQSYDAEDGGVPALGLWSSEGTADAPAALHTGDPMGGLYWKGYDGVTPLDSLPSKAQLTCWATTDFADGNWGTQIAFATTLPGTAANSGRKHRMLINDSGTVYIGNAGGSGATPNPAHSGGQLVIVPNAGLRALDVYGDVMFAGTNSTGIGSTALGSNCPANTVTAPYTWIRAVSSDGSTVWIPAWK